MAKKFKLYRNSTLLSDYDKSIEKLDNADFLSTKEDGEILSNRFVDNDGTPRSIVGVVGENENGKYIEKIDMYQWDGGYYNMEYYQRQKEQKILVNVPGSIYFYDKKYNTYFLTRGNVDFTKYDIERYIPIGVLVIPMNHDVYGDGSAAIMSLKAMNCDTPDSGSTSEQKMHWGVYGTNISTMTDFGLVNYVGTGSTLNSAVQGAYNYTHLPSDKFSSVQNPYDTDTYYYFNDSLYRQAPSPYNEDDSRNPAYYQTSSPASTANALSDFDGVGNTEKIITQRGTKDYSSWTPGSSTEADYPAASCCDMFHTDGTEQGDWYLPACGELGYIMPKFNAINTSIAALISAYGNSVGVQLNSNDYYWSSSEYSSNHARYVGTYYGSVSNYAKDANRYVRAFLRIGSI